MPVGRLERRVVNYVALSASIGAVLLGFLVLYLASKDDIFFTHPNVREVTREVGAVVVVTGLLTIFWELIAKRSFAEELLARVGTGKEIAASGLVGVTPNFHRDIDWPDLFRNTRELDIFFAYGGTCATLIFMNCRHSCDKTTHAFGSCCPIPTIPALLEISLGVSEFRTTFSYRESPTPRQRSGISEGSL
ncbi:MAG: hypothetical protein ACXW28_04765, partial [Thermoanaerobaculia bacterium]